MPSGVPIRPNRDELCRDLATSLDTLLEHARLGESYLADADSSLDVAIGRQNDITRSVERQPNRRRIRSCPHRERAFHRFRTRAPVAAVRNVDAGPRIVRDNLIDGWDVRMPAAPVSAHEIVDPRRRLAAPLHRRIGI